MLKDQVHPAAIRSKNCLVDSLLELMKVHEYDKITITEITEHALLTRRTFYAHFKTKADVLSYKITSLNNQLIKVLSTSNQNDHHEISLIYFNFWFQHESLLLLMKQANLLPLLFENFDQNIRDIRTMFGCQFSKDNQLYLDYSSAFFTGILSNMLSQWLTNGCHESAEDLVQLLEQITHKFASNFLT